MQKMCEIHETVWVLDGISNINDSIQNKQINDIYCIRILVASTM